MAWRTERALNRSLLLGLLGTLMLLLFPAGWAGAQSDPPASSSVKGDLDSDCDVDRLDLNILLAARNTPAAGEDDPRDLDGDGRITVLDARKLVLLCTQPRCAILQSTCDQANEPPTADAGPDRTLTLAPGQTEVDVTLSGAGSDDSDGSIVDYAWTGDPDPNDEEGPVLSLPAGVYTFTLVVTDDDGAESAPDSCVITVEPAPNQPPVAEAGPDQTYILAFGQAEKLISLDASGSSDPDGQIAAYTWTGAPNPADEAQPSVSLSPGIYAFTLVVTDDAGIQSDPDTVTVEILPPPEAHAPQVLLEQTAYEVDEGETLSFTVSATDPEDENLSIMAAPKIPNTSFASATGTDPSGIFTFEPDHSQQGMYTVAFTARDAVGLADTKTVRIRVNNVNRRPTLAVPTGVTVDEGGMATIQLVGEDPDGGPITLSAEPLPDNALFLPSTGAVVFAPDYGQAGTYQILCTASDGDLETSETLQVVVNDVVIGGGGEGQKLKLFVNPVETPTFQTTTRITGSVNADPAPQPARIESALITGMAPASGTQGQTLEVLLTGQPQGDYVTHFEEGISEVDFGEGVTVDSLEVTGPAEATASISISPSAQCGPRVVTLSTDSETAVATVGFHVTPGQSEVTGVLVDPDSGQAIGGAVVTIQGTSIQTVTDADGSFALTSAPAGALTLIVNAPDHRLIVLEIDAETGERIDLGTLESAPTVYDPGSLPSATVMSVIGRGVPRMRFTGDAEEARELIEDTIQVVGGTRFGVLDEYGNQLNPNVDGNGMATLKAEAVDAMIEHWQIGETEQLGSMLLGFIALFEWDGAAPSPYELLAALQDLVDRAWNDPYVEDNLFPVILFNRGASISPNAPRLSLNTPLNPLQAYLLSATLLGYMNHLLFLQDFPDGDLTGSQTVRGDRPSAPVQLASNLLDFMPPGTVVSDAGPYMRLAQADPNLPPVAVAGVPPGQDTNVQLTGKGSIRVALDGSRSHDPDGSIVAYRWVRTSSEDQDPADVAQPHVDLSGGRYHTFRLIVQDNEGAWSPYDEVTFELGGDCGFIHSTNPTFISWCDLFQTLGEDKVKGAVTDIEKTSEAVYRFFKPALVDTATSKAETATKWIQLTKDLGIQGNFTAKKKIRQDFLTQYRELHKAAEDADKIVEWSKGISDVIKDTMSAVAGKVMDGLVKDLLFKKLASGAIDAARPEPPIIERAEVMHNEEGLPEAVRIEFHPCIDQINAAVSGVSARYYYLVYRQNPKAGGLALLALLPSYKYHETLASRPDDYAREMLGEFLKRDPNLLLTFVDPDPPLGTNSYKLVTRIIRGPVPPKTYIEPEKKMGLEILVARGGGAASMFLDMVLTASDTLQDVIVGTRYQISEFSNPEMVYVGALTENLYPRIDLAVADRTGDVYISIPDTGRILRWTPAGIDPFTDSGFKTPFQSGLAVDPWGNVFTDNKASDLRFGGKIFRFSAGEAQRQLIGSVNYYSALLQYARSADVKAITYGFDPVADRPYLYIADTADRRISKLDLRNGAVIHDYLSERNVSHNYAVSNLFLFQGNTHLHYSYMSNRIYATQGNELLVGYPDGTAQSPFYMVDNPFESSWLTGLDGDANGNLYVADMFTGRVVQIPYWYMAFGGYTKDPDYLDHHVVVEGLQEPLDLKLSADASELLVIDGMGLKRIRLGLSGRIWDKAGNLPLAGATILVNGQAVGQTNGEGYFRLVNIDATGRVRFVVQAPDGRVEDLSRYPDLRFPYPGEGHIVMENDIVFDVIPEPEPLDMTLEPDDVTIEDVEFPQEAEVMVDYQDVGRTIERDFILPGPRIDVSDPVRAAVDLPELPTPPPAARRLDRLEPGDVPRIPGAGTGPARGPLGKIHRIRTRLLSPVEGLKVPRVDSGPPRTTIRGVVLAPEDLPEAAPSEVTLEFNGRTERVAVNHGVFERAGAELREGLNRLTVRAEPSEVIRDDAVIIPGGRSYRVGAGPYGTTTTAAPEPPALRADDHALRSSDPGGRPASRRNPDEGIGFSGFVLAQPSGEARPRPLQEVRVSVYDTASDPASGGRLVGRALTDDVGFYQMIVPRAALAADPDGPMPDPADPASMASRSLRVVVDHVRSE